MTNGQKQCACGWRRPLLFATTTTGEQPTEDLLLGYLCPCCGAGYVAADVPEEQARKILAALPRRPVGVA